MVGTCLAGQRPGPAEPDAGTSRPCDIRVEGRSVSGLRPDSLLRCSALGGLLTQPHMVPADGEAGWCWPAARPAPCRAILAGSRPLCPRAVVCCRAERCNASPCCWPAPCQLHQLQAHLCGSVSNLSSAEHRSRLSGRRPLSERPSTRVSHCRTVPTAGSAGLGRWPARHVPTIARSRDFYFRKS